MKAPKNQKTSSKRVSAETLKALLDQLEGLQGLFPERNEEPYKEASGETPSSVPVPIMAEQSANKEVDSDEEPDFDPDEDDYSEKDTIDAEELEAAVDVLLSEMNSYLADKKEAKSIQELFALLFGEESRCVKIAADFEDAINGYFGHLFGKDLDLAEDRLDQLITYVRSRIKRCKT